MEIQSGNGEEVASAVSATSGFVSRCHSGPRVEPSGDSVPKEDLQAAKRIERFDIPLDSLKRMFEKPAGPNSEVSTVSLSKRSRSQTKAKDQTMASSQEIAAGSADSASGLSGEGSNQHSRPPHVVDDPESVSLKDRLAMYQAAVSSKESGSSSSALMMEESEACSLPGGLASVKKQFENQEFVSSSSQSSSTQYHFQQRSVQEICSSSEVTVRSSVREVVPTTAIFHDQQEVIYDQSIHNTNLAASHGSHYNQTVMLVGGEDLPKVSTQALKQQYEKTIEEAAPAREIKVDVDFNQFQWTPVNQSSKVSTVTSHESSAVQSASTSVSAAMESRGSTDYFPPPPVNVELSQDVSHHTAGQQKFSTHKEQYFTNKSMAELKRLYKHIHPEVRKNLEEDFLNQLSEAEIKQLESEEVVGDVQQACFLFENDGNSHSECSSPDRESVEWDEILRGEVESRRWMFENKPLDTIKDDTPDGDEDTKLAQQEIIAGKDVRYTAWMFETQPMDALGTEDGGGSDHSKNTADLARGDVRTATWLFETQPLDYLNKIYQEDEPDAEAVVTKDITGGDVKTVRYLFETQHLDSLGKTETIEESRILSLKSEREENRGDVKTTTRMFETQPMCVIRGDSGEMLEITTISREETEKGDVKTSRWMFETQPLDMINKDPAQVKLICGISIDESVQGGVNKGCWLFETKTLDTIKDEEWESSRWQKEEIIGADVRKHCLVFETQPMDTLKDNDNARPLPSEEIVGGDVQTAKHLFETVPMENLKELSEVGKLQKMVASEEERGDVRHQKWVFESQPLENIREEKKEITRTVNIEDLDKGDVSNYKERFESMDLSKCEETQKIQVEGVTSGAVRSNTVLFESTPMYAMQDSSGHYHEVKTVRREEIVKGDVRSCRWMFETRPIDEFDESIDKFQIIKGISKQEIESGDVKTAKWLFETQQLDAIKYFNSSEVEENSVKTDIEIQKGDVKTCRWLFETQPMDVLYEKVERSESDVEEVHKGDVKTCTWLFETQTLDNIRDHSESESETILRTCTVKQEDIQGKDVRLARFLFETENLENIGSEDSESFRRVTEIDIHSGDVSRMKYIFENQPSDIMSSTSKETMQKLKTQQAEDIQRGNVVNCTWMFENHPIDSIQDESHELREIRTVTDIQGGDVDKGRFIFETYSLDRIKEASTEIEISNLTSTIRSEIEKGDVKNYTMMFETQPLYAIRDKDGHYHEVTTVTKEEVLRGDVVGARWLFETKPLDCIRDSEEVYIIKAVTEEDINKGDVSSARWKFETQPLDKITEEIKVMSKTVADVQGGDVKTNKHRFETDEMSQKLIRTVSVSEIQKGDVRSATWMFETRTIDEIHGECTEYDGMERVTKEEVMKGDVKQSVWLFEKQPLDTIKETDGTELIVTKEEIPKADVRTTTWLFERTPFDEFNESTVEKKEIIGKSIKETLEELYCQKMVNSQGILIEADEIGDVRMAKYKLMNQDSPQIQKEEIIRGDLSNIMMNLLNRRETTERGITIDEEERGNINTTVEQLLNQEKGLSVEKEEVVRGDIQEAINNLLKSEGSSKSGILIQEDEKGDVRMTIYSLLNKEEGASMEKEEIIQGNVSKTLHRLLSNAGDDATKRIRVGDSERGNVSFYTTCIESGALDYLRQLQYDSGESVEVLKKEQIIGGDIEETKILLRKNQQEIGRTVAEEDIVPGDVGSIVKDFMTEPTVTYRNLEKNYIVKGDVNAALDSLSQAINQKVVMEKEEVVKGDISTTLKYLEEAQHQSRELERPEIVRGDIQGALQSLERSVTMKTEVTVDDLVPGDIKGTLKSLEEAKQAVKEVEKEEIVHGDIHTAMLCLHEASSEKRTYQHQVSEQGDVKATIQMFLEPTNSPRMQRRGSIEGDVKTSIKSLYEGQETTQVEKEEVVKGDVQGTIKCLMQKKEYTKPKRVYTHKKAKASVKNPLSVNQVEHERLHEARRESDCSAPAVKNLTQSGESQKHTRRLNESKSVKTQVVTQEDHSSTVSKTDNTSGSSQQMCMKDHKQKVLPAQKTQSPKPIMIKNKQMTINESSETKAAGVDIVQVVHNTSQKNISQKQISETKTTKQVQTTLMERTVTQKQSVMMSDATSEKQKGSKMLSQKESHKNLKMNHRNLDMIGGKGFIKKGKPEIHFPPPPSSPPPSSESELSLPPPPSPVLESPATLSSTITRQDSDLPPPPSPVECSKAESEFFPPPPPPPPPVLPGQDFLPPPPMMEELNTTPATVKYGKPIGKPLFKVPNPPEPQKPIQVKPKWQKKLACPQPQPEPQNPHGTQRLTELQIKTSTKIEEKRQTQAQMVSVSASEMANIPIKPAPKESPQPRRKVLIPPIKLPPTPEPASEPKTRPYARKFKTPLMLAEEKYRQQRMEKEEIGKSGVSTPTSPPVNMKAPSPVPASGVTLAQNLAKDVAREATIDNAGTNILREVSDASVKKTPSQIPKKPLISNMNKKTGYSSMTMDQRNDLSKDIKKAPAEVIKKTQTTPDIQRQSVGVSSHRETARVEVQSHSKVVTSVTHEQSIKKSSTKSITASQSAVQENVNAQSPAGAPARAEDAKNINERPTQEGKVIPSQPTKIPKVTPSFKVKTFKMPPAKKEEDHLSETEVFKTEKKSSQSQKSEIISQQRTMKTEVVSERKVMETQKLGAAPGTEARLEKQKNESDVTLSPAVTVLMPKELKKKAPSAQGHAPLSHSKQSVTEERVQQHQEAVVMASVAQESCQGQQVISQQSHLIKQPKAETHQITGSSKEVRGALVKESGKMTRQIEMRSEEKTHFEKIEVMQRLLTQIKDLVGAPSKIDSHTVGLIITELPLWSFSLEEKNNLNELAKHQNKKKLKDMLQYVSNILQAKILFLEESISHEVNEEKRIQPPAVPPKPDKTVSGTKISKISIGSSKTEKKVFEGKRIVHESKLHQETADQSVCSPLASIRTPSPTFISIESRRIDSPLGATPSPPPYKSVGTPPPPPRKTYTPTFSRASPSPTLCRSEKLMKLRDTTSKLSVGITPPPHTTVPEFLATEITQSSTCDRETPDQTEQGLVDVTEMVDSMMTVRDKKSFFEEAQKAEINRNYIRKDPIEIPERLGPDVDEGAETVTIDLMKEDLPKVDLSKLVNRFESPKPKVYPRKEPIVIKERLGSDTEDTDADPHTPKTEEIPSFNVKAIKDVFETGQHSSQAARELREQIERREQNSVHSEPFGHSQATSLTEGFSCIDDFGNMTREMRSEMHSESSFTRGNPPSYAEVVRGSVPTLDMLPEASAEELLRNFQQSWAESQAVFQNLGFSVTEQRTAQTVTHQQETKIRVPESELCRVCRKRVYPMESLIADKQNFHKSCFRCEHCRGTLSLGNYAALHGRMYCKPHYMQLFASKGNYDEGFGQKPHKDLWNNKSLVKSPSPEKKSPDCRSTPDQFATVDGDVSISEAESRKPASKISVVWPPQTDSPQKSFTIEEELRLVKPSWPPTSHEEERQDVISPDSDQALVPNDAPGYSSASLPKDLRDPGATEEQFSPPLVAEEAPNNTQSQVPERSSSSAEAEEQVESEIDSIAKMEDQSEENAVESISAQAEEKKSEEGAEEVNVNGRCEQMESVLDEKGGDGGVNREEVGNVMLTDEGVTEGQTLNTNNNNNKEATGADCEIWFREINEGEDHRSSSETGSRAALFSPSENSDRMPTQVWRLAERGDAVVSAGAKCTESAHCFSETDCFVDKAEGPFSLTDEPKTSASSFLEDIFAGLSTQSSTLLSDFNPEIFGQSALGSPQGSTLDDLLDFGKDWQESTERRSEKESGMPRKEDDLCGWDDDTLTVEEQIKRNRFYDDNEDS